MARERLSRMRPENGSERRTSTTPSPLTARGKPSVRSSAAAAGARVTARIAAASAAERVGRTSASSERALESRADHEVGALALEVARAGDPQAVLRGADAEAAVGLERLAPRLEAVLGIAPRASQVEEPE